LNELRGPPSSRGARSFRRGIYYSINNNVANEAGLVADLRFSTSELVAELNRSPIGQEVLSAVNQSRIHLEFEGWHSQPSVMGYNLPVPQGTTPRAVVFVENNALFTPSGQVNRAASLQNVGN